MTNKDSIVDKRRQIVAQLFPDGVPILWCPLLTHYDSEGAIDKPRMAAHLDHLAPHVGGFLVPGSTGDGWEMDAEETLRVLGVVLDLLALYKTPLLAGVLAKDPGEARFRLRQMLEWLNTLGRGPAARGGLSNAWVRGFTICPPAGKERREEEIREALETTLGFEVPVALYQLPQVTQNEMEPGLLSEMAERFEQFILFKDSSGTDRVALSGQSLPDIFLMRGAEGDYARWLKLAGGPYDGFLLSTANCFAGPLATMIIHLRNGVPSEANKISTQISGVIKEVFSLVASLPDGNPFTNANKAIDHFFAWGSRAAAVPPPRLHAGSRLPTEVIRATGDVLTRFSLMPSRGYLE